MATGGCGRAPPIRGLAMVPTCVVYLDAVDVQIASTCRTCLGIGALAEERFCGVVAPLPPKDNLNRSPMSLVSNTSIAQTGPHLQDPASAAVHMLRSSRNRRSTASQPHDEPGPVKFCPPPACSQRTTLCLSCLLPSRTPVDRLLDRCRHQMLLPNICTTSALPLHQSTALASTVAARGVRTGMDPTCNGAMDIRSETPCSTRCSGRSTGMKHLHAACKTPVPGICREYA
jgi:hypothetical protein